MSVEPLAAVVVDASVVIKWLLPEPDSAAALAHRHRWRAQGLVPVAPDFLLIELHNVLWKKLQRGELAPDAPILTASPTMGLDLDWFPFEPLLAPAWQVACRCGISMYDALYAALAQQLHARFYTADAQLARRLSHFIQVTTLSPTLTKS